MRAGQSLSSGTDNPKQPVLPGRERQATIWAVNALFAMLLAVMGIFSIAALQDSIRAIRYPYDIDYGEGIVLWQAAHVDRLDAAYAPVTQDHVVVFHYPPVYHYASRIVASLTGDLLVGGRTVSTLASIAIALLVLAQVLYAAPARSWTSLSIAALAALLCYLSANQRLWSTVMRVDTFAVALGFAGVFLFTLSWRYRHAIWFASVLFVLGAFTKQTLVTAPFVCFIVALALDRRKALRLAATTAVLAGVAVVILTTLTHGEFLKHTVQYNANPFSLHTMVQQWRMNLTGKAGITTLAFVFVAWVASGLARKAGISQLQSQSNESRFWLTAASWSTYFLVSLIATAASGKQGSSFNYFIEWNAICAVLGGLAFLLLVSEIQLSKVSLAVLLAMAFPIVCVSESVVTFKTSLGWLRTVPGPHESEWLVSEQKAFEFISQANGPVFSDVMIPVVKSGKELEGEPAIMTGLSDAGLWDQAAFVAKIRRGYFDRVLVENFVHPFFTPEMQSAIKETYTNVHEVGSYRMFEKP